MQAGAGEIAVLGSDGECWLKREQHLGSGMLQAACGHKDFIIIETSWLDIQIL
jgi:hypothetical protein